MSRTTVIILIVVALLVGFFGGRMLLPQGEAEEQKVAGAAQEDQTWTCSMHPQIQQPEPGQCPICGMDLIPVASEEDEQPLEPRQIKLSPMAQQLAEVRVSPAVRQFVDVELRLSGKVDYDETRLGHITARVPGRLDRLFVDYTGIPVKKGEHLVYLYSPELLTAQEELLQSLKAVEELKSSNLQSVRKTAMANVEAVREKLRLWGLTADQIEQIVQRKEPSDHMTIYAPMGGIVIEKNAVEGMYVDTGTRIYTIADLSQVWVKLDAYESDLPFLRYAQPVSIETEAYPGEEFTGTIAFIDPVLDEKTRTADIRVNVGNPEGKLKPGLFVRGRVYATVAEGGRVVSTELAGKWICPMHPEIIKEGPGECDICEMPLAQAESLGYVDPDAQDLKQPPLVIPASAPLITGERAVVYVAVPQREGVYEGREIVLGPRTGEFFVVRDGLSEGEMVVTHGNFKIDSAVQIAAGPSMMNPEGAPAAATDEHRIEGEPGHQMGSGSKHQGHTGSGSKHKAEKKEGLDPDVAQLFKEDILPAYFSLQEALSSDDIERGRELTDELLSGTKQALETAKNTEVSPQANEQIEQLAEIAQKMDEAKDITELRERFVLLSDALAKWLRGTPMEVEEPIYRIHCPMAFNNRGADWLQNHKTVENPYFGEAMLRCGETVETFGEE